MFFLVLVIFLLIGGVLTLVTWQNLGTLTQLNFYFWKTPEVPVGLVFVGAIFVGALFMYIVAVLAARRERRELRRLRVRVGELEKEERQIAYAPDAVFPAQEAMVPLSPPVVPIKMPGMTGPLPTPPRK